MLHQLSFVACIGLLWPWLIIWATLIITVTLNSQVISSSLVILGLVPFLLWLSTWGPSTHESNKDVSFISFPLLQWNRLRDSWASPNESVKLLRVGPLDEVSHAEDQATLQRIPLPVFNRPNISIVAGWSSQGTVYLRKHCNNQNHKL